MSIEASYNTFQTPPRQIVRQQEGISRHYETVERAPIFSGEVLPVTDASSLGDKPQSDGFQVSYYTTPAGKTHAIVQQRPTGAPCGYGCLMMLFLDRMLQSKDPSAEYQLQSNRSHSFIDTFYRNDNLTNAYQLKNIAKNCETGLALKVIEFVAKKLPSKKNDKENIQPQPNTSSNNDMLSTFFADEVKKADVHIDVATNKGVCRALKAQLKKGSVIQAITHPELAGHWVIVDEFAKGFFYIRDPYSAKAYKVKETELAPMLLKGIQAEYGVLAEDKPIS